MGQTNYSIGHEAEKRAATYLQESGYQIVDLNWKIPAREVDIVAKKHGVISFVEVKFRKNSDHGTGLEYITPKKLKQMSFAAELWVQQNGWKGAYNLAAIELTGEDFQITHFVENIG